jgi:hypothetical protein
VVQRAQSRERQAVSMRARAEKATAVSAPDLLGPAGWEHGREMATVLLFSSAASPERNLDPQVAVSFEASGPLLRPEQRRDSASRRVVHWLLRPCRHTHTHTHTHTQTHSYAHMPQTRPAPLLRTVGGQRGRLIRRRATEGTPATRKTTYTHSLDGVRTARPPAPGFRARGRACELAQTSQDSLHGASRPQKKLGRQMGPAAEVVWVADQPERQPFLQKAAAVRAERRRACSELEADRRKKKEIFRCPMSIRLLPKTKIPHTSTFLNLSQAKFDYTEPCVLGDSAVCVSCTWRAHAQRKNKKRKVTFGHFSSSLRHGSPPPWSMASSAQPGGLRSRHPRHPARSR